MSAALQRAAAAVPANFLRLDVAFEAGCKRVLESLGREFQLDLWGQFEREVKREARRLRRYNPDRRTRAKMYSVLQYTAEEFRRAHAGAGR